jgi:periplasmic protein TonB
MLDFKPPAPNKPSETPAAARPRSNYQANQQRLMGTALALLLCTLVFVLYRDRDFWFPDGQDLDEQAQATPAATPAAAPVSDAKVREKARAHNRLLEKKTDPIPPEPDPPASGVTITRTVLPPLEVEVVAGGTHKTLHPNNNSIQVDMDNGSTPPVVAARPARVDASTASVTSNAAERVHISSEAAAVVTRSVKPSYPTLARQMKVQGSVVLQAMISRDGLIEDLRVVSGPTILADAAKDAVRQWQFKPHYNGSKPVETQARITVNFTISTN